jgi:hypothetical protein
MTVADAAYALAEIAAGRTPERSRLLAGALVLDTLRLRGGASQDVLDAAAGLELVATGGVLDLDERGRTRAAHLADAVAMLNNEEAR